MGLDAILIGNHESNDRTFFLIRFDQEEIHYWLASFTPAHGTAVSLSSPPKAQRDVESLIAAAKRDVYTPHRETRPREKKGVSPDGSV